MKKKINLIICMLLAVAVFATIFIGCQPPDPAPKPVNYAVKPLNDLTDFSSTATKAAVVYTVDGAYTDARNNLAAKIKTEKSYFDAFNGDADNYTRYTADDLETGTATPVEGRYEEGERVEQSSLIKILAHADPDQLIYVLGYSGLEKPEMISLIDYIAKDGTGAMDDANISRSTGLIEDYEAIRKWSDEVDEKGTSTQDGQTAYKNRARKSRAMNKRLFDTGMDGGDAGRAMLEVFEYVQIIAEDMRETYNEAYAGAPLDNMTEYFKKELLDYDTIVLIRANNDRRWGTAGQVKTAMNKEVKYNETTHSYSESYQKPAADAGLVQAYGYSFEYERGNYNALSDDDFEKELTYRFKNSMTTDEAKDYRRIQSAQYEKAFRYSEDFYKKYYESLNPINVAQEKYEGAVFGFTNEDRKETGHPFKDVSSTIYVQGVGGDMTEPEIKVNLGGTSAGSYSDMTYNALQVGLGDQLKAGDMQHYYWAIDDNVIEQNNANNDRMSSDAGSQAKGSFNLKLVNLKMADFVLSTFVNEKNAKGLTNIMKAQTRLYVADYTRMVKAFRRQVVRQLAELEKEGVLVARRVGNDIRYEFATGVTSYTSEQQEAVRDNIGRASAMINSLDGKRLSTNIDNRFATLANTKWDTIAKQIKDTATYNYNQHGANIAWGKKSKILEGLLIKKKDDGSYDTNWETSVFVSNNSNVLAYSSGQINVDFRIATASAFSQNGVINDGRTSFGDVYGYSGDTLKTIIDSQNYDDNNIAQGIEFAEVSLNNGTKYKAKTDKFYLKYVYTGANQTQGTPESGKYYYEVLATDVMEYDITLVVEYTQA